MPSNMAWLATVIRITIAPVLIGALAVLVALWHRRRTGIGQWIDLSQFENLAALLGPRLLDLLVRGQRSRAALGNVERGFRLPLPWQHADPQIAGGAGRRRLR